MQRREDSDGTAAVGSRLTRGREERDSENEVYRSLSGKTEFMTCLRGVLVYASINREGVTGVLKTEEATRTLSVFLL